MEDFNFLAFREKSERKEKRCKNKFNNNVILWKGSFYEDG